MTAAEFSVAGVVAGDQSSPLAWVRSHALRHRGALAAFLSGAFFNAALAAAVPTLVGAAYALIEAPARDERALVWVAVAVAVSQVVRGFWQLGRNFSAELIGQRLERDARAELFVSLLGKSMTFHGLRPVGEIMARATNDVRELNLMFNPGLNLVVGSANFLLMPLVAGPAIHPQLVLVPLLFILSYVVSVRAFLRELRPVTEHVRQSFGAMNAGLEEALEGIETVKAAAREPAEVERFEAAAQTYRDAYVRQGRIEARFLPLLFLALAMAFGFLHAFLLFLGGAISAGQVVAYNFLILLFGFPTFVSLQAYSQISSGLASGRRILELVNTRTDLDQNPAGRAEPLRGAVAFEAVSFGYRPGEPILQQVSFSVQPGQTVAVVGQTGAGKTTLIRMINRTYEAGAGRVLLDGVDVRAWNLEALRRQISIIEQDIFLFSRTVAENIAFGRPGAGPEEIEAAARAAQAHDFITAFKDGYATTVGERGVMLSGGQRQRLALARAFLTDPRILILDDSTSAIDSATEDQIQRAIFRAAQGRTTFLITHRLSQIRWADVILVLRRGRVAASGTHEALMETSEAYRRIFARYEGGR